MLLENIKVAEKAIKLTLEKLVAGTGLQVSSVYTENDIIDFKTKERELRVSISLRAKK